MSDHLPECDLHDNGCKHDYYPDPPLQCANCGESCICDRLRACEQRVVERETRIQAGTHRVSSMAGYANGLEAARDALEGLLHEDPCDCDTCRVITQAQAAIDDLRGEL